MDSEKIQALAAILKPWHEAIDSPAAAQAQVLQRLLEGYARTAYGRDRGAGQVGTLEEYRRQFPVLTYDEYKPLIGRVMAGDTGLLLYEEPVGWAITRGTTEGESKFIPMTQTDIMLRISAGRAMLNYMLSKGCTELLDGTNINLNFPSMVGKVQAGGRQLEYGYSSGIYLKFVSKFTPIRSVPSQDEIDALGGGKSLSDWHARFDLAYQKCKSENVTMVGGVAPTALLFGRYMKRAHKAYPKDVWRVRIMTLGSVAGINTTYEPALTALYGRVDIREIYGATEGMFGQQRDHRRAWVPNYDQYFFEVETRRGIKLLHDMRPGEMGSLVVSTPILARYKIGDLIRAFQPPYFRCIGRDRWWTPLHYAWGETMSLNLGRL